MDMNMDAGLNASLSSQMQLATKRRMPLEFNTSLALISLEVTALTKVFTDAYEKNDYSNVNLRLQSILIPYTNIHKIFSNIAFDILNSKDNSVVRLSLFTRSNKTSELHCCHVQFDIKDQSWCID